jgi:hypothetical protein
MRTGLSIHHHKALEVKMVALLILMVSASTRFGEEEGRFGLCLFISRMPMWVGGSDVCFVCVCVCMRLHASEIGGLFVYFKERRPVVMATPPTKQKINCTQLQESTTLDQGKRRAGTTIGLCSIIRVILEDVSLQWF